MKEKNILLLIVAIMTIGLVSLGAMLYLASKPSNDMLGANGSSFISSSNQVEMQGQTVDIVTHNDANTNVTTSTQPAYIFNFTNAGYKYGSFQAESLANLSFIIQGSNDQPASSSVASWTDITTDITGGASVSSDQIIFLDTEIIANQIRLLFTTSSADATGTIKSTFSN